MAVHDPRVGSKKRMVGRVRRGCLYLTDTPFLASWAYRLSQNRVQLDLTDPKNDVLAHAGLTPALSWHICGITCKTQYYNLGLRAHGRYKRFTKAGEARYLKLLWLSMARHAVQKEVTIMHKLEKEAKSIRQGRT